MPDISTYMVNPSDRESMLLLQAVIDALDDPIFVKDLEHRWIACNQAGSTLLGVPREGIIGHSDPEYFPPEQVEVFWRIDDQVISSGQRCDNEEEFTDIHGVLHTIWTRKFPLRDQHEAVIGLAAVITDITPIRRRQEQITQLEMTIQEKEAALVEKEAELEEKLAIIDAQGSLLEELSAPVIEVWDKILLLPLVGTLDSQRASRVLENLLETIVRDGAQVVILDITGVPVVDTSVTGYLVRAVQASQLLGCESILVGISPEIAQSLVGLGIDFSHITTRATLQNGLAYALKRLDYTINRNQRTKTAP